MMTIYIALLRGINVGGHNKIRMAELKAMLEARGYIHVQTYIQSGNVLLASDRSAQTVQEQMEKGILETFGLKILVVVRTIEQWEAAIAACPYTPDAAAQLETVYVAFLGQPLTDKEQQRLLAQANAAEEVTIDPLHVYLHLHEGARDSKTSQALSKFVSATVRNWNTTNKLYALAQQLQQTVAPAP